MKVLRRIKYISVFFVLLHVVGFLTAIDAVMGTRTPQGAIAWVISLNTFPSIALPAYWVFGRTKFNGYTKAFQEDESQLAGLVRAIDVDGKEFRSESFDEAPALLVGEKLANLPMLEGNATELLINGEATFSSIFDGIDKAQHYILVQFFIVKNDELGQKLKKRLIHKAQDGVEVYFLYDEIGSYALGKTYLDEMRAAGIHVANFHSRKGPKNRFQINFRNHRKIVLVDGLTCWIGGHNVGDDYLGKGKKFSFWRDTHLKITGPATLAVQLSFLEDYHWATDTTPILDWKSSLKKAGDKKILIIPSGPADKLETAGLMFHHAINSAQKRLWIASPYFVPDEAIVSALSLAALRGVDVRILIPDEPDHLSVYLAGFSYVRKFKKFPNIKFYRYTKGFMHQKTLLIDDVIAGVGTANFDNRSFRLNFELTALVKSEQFNMEVEQMFLNDFSHSRLVESGEYNDKPFLFKLAVRVVNLAAPML